jgi:hypothetical protein
MYRVLSLGWAPQPLQLSMILISSSSGGSSRRHSLMQACDAARNFPKPRLLSLCRKCLEGLAALTVVWVKRTWAETCSVLAGESMACEKPDACGHDGS